jgi:hypothetical protein
MDRAKYTQDQFWIFAISALAKLMALKATQIREMLPKIELRDLHRHRRLDYKIYTTIISPVALMLMKLSLQL